MTIIEAVKKVMLLNGKPMTANEAYHAIMDLNLYTFHTDKPIQVVRIQIRRHCLGLDFPSASHKKHFKIIGNNRFWPLEETSHLTIKKNKVRKKIAIPTRDTSSGCLKELQKLHSQYISEFKRKILSDLKHLAPEAFELFSKRLLDVYGFQETEVTKVSGDGGIDGYGKLKVGLAHLNVAYQCKRWTKGNIQRQEVDKFRGAIQGDFEQGLFFTTTSFSEGAIKASIKAGAVPVVLINGEAIIDLMIEKGFGIQIDSLPIFSNALDIALTDEDFPEKKV